jgi:DNA primase
METTKEAIKKAGKAVVVEGELDMISSYQAGVTNVVAIKGSALTENQLDLLKRFCDNLILSLDMDTAGDAASRRGIELAENKGLNVRVIRLLYGKDPDECARHSGKLWHDSVKAAVPVYDFYIESAVKRFGTDTPEGKRQISDELSPVLARISNRVILSHYLKKLSGILGVSEEAVSEEVTKSQKAGERPKSFKPAIAPALPESRQEMLEQYLLALTLPLGLKAVEAFERLEAKWLNQSAPAQALTKLKDWLEKNKQLEINRFIATLPEELVAAVDQAYLTDLKDLNDDDDELSQEAIKTVYELKSLATKNKLTELSQQLKAAEADRDKEKITRLKREFVETSKILGYNHD